VGSSCAGCGTDGCMQTGAESHGEQAGRLHHVPAWVSMDAGRRAEGSCAEDGRRKVSCAPSAGPMHSTAGPLPSAGLCSWPPAPLASRTQHHTSCAKHRAPMKYQYVMYVPSTEDQCAVRIVLLGRREGLLRLGRCETQTEADSTLTSSGTERGPDGYGRCPRPTEAGLGGRQAPPRFPPQFLPDFRRLSRFTTESCKQRTIPSLTGSTTISASIPTRLLNEWTDGRRAARTILSPRTDSNLTAPRLRFRPDEGCLTIPTFPTTTTRPSPHSFLLSFFPSPYFRLTSRAAYRHRAVPHCQHLGIWRRKQTKPEDCTDDAMRCDALRYAAAAFSFSFPIAGPYRRPYVRT
jgi:hypothetical protein